MTEKTQPTDAELEKLFVEETGFDIDDFPAAILDFARAVLQRWGPPSGAGNHPHAIQWDAELGRTAMRFVDRAGDVHPGIDDAETICADFHKAMSAVIERMPHVQRMSAPQPSPTAQAAPAAGAVAGSEWKLVPVEPTDDMLRAIRNQRSGGRVGAGDRADWAAWLAAAPTPPAQAADSVLEDAARLDWLALAGPTSICLVIDRPHDSEVEVSTDDVTGYGKTLREALDAARKQGANHD